MSASTEELIQHLVASKQFQSLLSQQVSKQITTANLSTHLTSLPLQSQTSSHTPPKSMQISDMIAQLSQNLQQIIIFNIKQALEQQYGLLLQDNSKMKNDIEDIRQQVLKISIKATNNKHLIDIKPTEIDNDFNDLEEMLDNQSKVGSKQYTKFKKQIQNIKLILLRFTNTSNNLILEEVFETDKKNKLEERINKLGKDVNELLQNSADGESLRESVGVEGCMREIQGIIERQKKFELSICEKYETSLKSVWNVITMMENNFEESRSGVAQIESPASRK